jgi:hypothetical protein
MNQNDFNIAPLDDEQNPVDSEHFPDAEHPVTDPGIGTIASMGYLTKIKRILVRFLLAIYIIMVLFFGYWYWARPVRADQFNHAENAWRELAEVFHVPLPDDVRWQD